MLFSDTKSNKNVKNYNNEVWNVILSKKNKVNNLILNC